MRAWRLSKFCPSEIRLSNRFAYVQLLVTGKLATGETLDVTRMVESSVSAGIVEMSRSGLIRPKADGNGGLDCAAGRQDRHGAGDGAGFEYAGTCRFHTRCRTGLVAAWL